MTTYGTISQEEQEPPNLVFVSRTKERIQTGLGTRRPWKEMIQPCHIRFPFSFFNSIHRIKTNAQVFRANYLIIILLVLFLSLLWHPISLIVFLVMMAAWLFLYFLRDDPLMVFGYVIDDRMVTLSLLTVTVGLLFLTNVTDNVILGISGGALLVLLHALMRDTEDLFSVDEEEEVAVVRVPLRQAASSSFTLS